MARAEYLKEQIKVGMGYGFLLSVVVHVPWLPSLATAALPLALLYVHR